MRKIIKSTNETANLANRVSNCESNISEIKAMLKSQNEILLGIQNSLNTEKPEKPYVYDSSPKKSATSKGKKESEEKSSKKSTTSKKTSTKKSSSKKSVAQTSEKKLVTEADFKEVDPKDFAPKSSTNYESVSAARRNFCKKVTGVGYVDYDTFLKAVKPWDEMYGTWNKSEHSLVLPKKSRKSRK